MLLSAAVVAPVSSDVAALPATQPAGRYGWPLEPFGAAHPVRGYFNDPRILRRTNAFHYGIDIVAGAGTPVYAVEGGVVRVAVDSLALVMPGGRRTFGYWHVDAIVRDGQHVSRHELLGRVQARGRHSHYADGRHLHFTELVDGKYCDPLRPGALTPWVDTTAPVVRRIVLERGGRRLPLGPVQGSIDVIVEAFDRPPLAVRPPWADMPVAPGSIRWRVLRGETVIRRWQTAVDLRHTLLPPARFRAVYAPGTRQNRPSQPGRYRFVLHRGWSTRKLAEGAYRIVVEAVDQFGNRGRGSALVRVDRR